MKVTQEQLNKLYKAIGLEDVEVVADRADSDFNMDEALQSVDATRSEILRPAIEKEVSESLKSSIAGKVGGILERELVRQTGIDAKLFTDGMKDEEKIKMAIAHKISLLDGEKADISKQLDDILSQHNTALETLKGEYEAKLTQAQNKYIDRDVNEYLFSSLKDAPLPSEADRMVLTKDFKTYLQNEFHVAYDEAKKELSIFQKDNPQLPVLNAAGTAKMTIADLAQQYFTPRNLWKTDTRHVNPMEQMRQTQTQSQMPLQVAQNNTADPAEALLESRKQFYQQQGLK